MSNLSRRCFLESTVYGATVPFLSALTFGNTLSGSESAAKETSLPFRSFGVTGNTVRLDSPLIKETVSLTIVGDTHLFRDDARGDDFKQYSGRMSKAYNHTRHFETEKPTNPEESFQATITQAKKDKTDALCLLGDIVSFPTVAGVEWVADKLTASKLTWCYIAGNHDWHYEGMPGSSRELRDTWTKKRLTPLYQGHSPLMYAVDVKGIRIVMMDDSIYEILPEQLDFFRQQVQSGKPLLLMMHIPLYAPGRSVGFGCGHPNWGAATDKNWKIERRPIWSKSHTPVTMTFHREVFSAPNLLGGFAGHVHRRFIDAINGTPQFTTASNSNGDFLRCVLSPAGERTC